MTRFITSQTDWFHVFMLINILSLLIDFAIYIFIKVCIYVVLAYVGRQKL